jgi:hypothetical protein
MSNQHTAASDTSIACAFCGESFSKKEALRKHRYERHTIPDVAETDGVPAILSKPDGDFLHCPHSGCIKKYKNRTSLQKHLTSHSEPPLAGKRKEGPEDTPMNAKRGRFFSETGKCECPSILEVFLKAKQVSMHIARGNSSTTLKAHLPVSYCHHYSTSPLTFYSSFVLLRTR